MDDAELTAMRSGDEAAFAAVHAACTPAMLRTARAITGDAAAAQDLVQEAWMAALYKLDGFEGRGTFRGWLFTILVNKARNRVRREARLRPLEPGDAEPGLRDRFDERGGWRAPPALWDEITPERQLAGKQVLALVRAVIETLPPTQQAIVALVEADALPTREIAALLGLSEGGVRVHLHRARARIRDEIDRHHAAASEKRRHGL